MKYVSKEDLCNFGSKVSCAWLAKQTPNILRAEECETKFGKSLLRSFQIYLHMYIYITYNAYITVPVCEWMQISISLQHPIPPAQMLSYSDLGPFSRKLTECPQAGKSLLGFRVKGVRGKRVPGLEPEVRKDPMKHYAAIILIPRKSKPDFAKVADNLLEL